MGLDFLHGRGAMAYVTEAVLEAALGNITAELNSVANNSTNALHLYQQQHIATHAQLQSTLQQQESINSAQFSTLSDKIQELHNVTTTMHNKASTY